MSRFAPQRSQEMAHAIQMLRSGQTRGQQNQAMADKAIMAGIQTALTVGGGALQANESDNLQAKQRAEENGRMKTERNARISGEASQYADANQTHELGGGQVPSWLTDGGETTPQTDLSLPEERDPFAQEQVKKLRAQQQANMAAAGANIGGYRTPKAMDDHDAESDTLAADMNTGKNLMKAGGLMSGGGNQMGGMMSSLRRSY